MKKVIAVIGATGNMGSNIAASLSKGGHKLILTAVEENKLAEHASKLRDSSNDVDISYTTDNKSAAQQADIIILAVWYQVQNKIAQEITDAAKGKIVISIANPFNDTYDAMLTPAGSSAAEELARHLPDSKVVKAFNTTFAADFQNTRLQNLTIDSFVAGDDDNAVNEVSELVKTAGFNPLNAGKLSTSKTLESMMLMLVGLTMRYNYNWIAGWKILTK